MQCMRLFHLFAVCCCLEAQCKAEALEQILNAVHAFVPPVCCVLRSGSTV
jgi:hypothetical protein